MTERIGIAALLCAIGCQLTPNQAPVTPDYPPSGLYPEPNDIVVVYPEDSEQARNSPCFKACTNIAKLGCPEGQKSAKGVSCYRTCAGMVQVRRVPVMCWFDADSVDHLRACGPEMRCRP